MAQIHVAKLALIRQTPSGRLYFPTSNKGIDGNPITTNDTLKYSEDFRLTADPTIPNTANYPFIKDYLELEATAGFSLAHMDQTFIITQK